VTLRHLILGIVLLAVAALAGQEAVQLTYWTALGPGPGFFPFWLAVLLGALALLLCIRSLPASLPALRHGKWEGARLDRDVMTKMAIVIGALVGVVLLLEPLGFRLTMLAMYLVLLYGLGQRDFLLSPLIALLGSFGAFHVFTQWLAVPLPAGVFGW
jgi:putative tricarboxylic transport membrane protein